MFAQLATAHQTTPKYQQGQTVESPFTTSATATAKTPAEMNFSIRPDTTLTPGVRLTINTATAFKIAVDGTPVLYQNINA